MDWLNEHYMDVGAAVLGLYAFAEFVVRITPTKTDDTLLERVGAGLKKVMDFLKIPNNLKK